jgi:divalent metal cation (Fe/Co/Zn/Cd) transporter
MMFSDSFGSRTKYAFDIATGNMWALTIFAIAVSIFIIFGVNQISRHFFVSASTYMDQPVGPSKFKQEQAKQDTSSNASTVNESDSIKKSFKAGSKSRKILNNLNVPRFAFGSNAKGVSI